MEDPRTRLGELEAQATELKDRMFRLINHLSILERSEIASIYIEAIEKQKQICLVQVELGVP